MSESIKLYTVGEAAARLGMGRSTLYRLIRAGKIPYHLMPTGVMRFTDQDLHQCLADAYRPVIVRKPGARRSTVRPLGLIDEQNS